MARLEQKTVMSPGFTDGLAGTLRTSAPFVRFLCEATGVAF